MLSTNNIRSNFLNFFNAHGHQVLPSAPLVLPDDPTLMFANAGMNPFKHIFTGVEKPPAPRATTAQKCVRAGGKHNDLDNVGYTARHHTFFEMLGNFSFGDYFKEEVIHFAWELLTKEFALKPEKLLVTVYHDDDEAWNIWKKLTGFADEKIIRIATADNFWSMGDTGPCGPCSEIFYDHGDHIEGGPPGSPGEDGDRFIEIWNLVFMQFNQREDGEREALPKPSIDTGMGLERITAVLQGVHDNYDIDLFKALIQASQEASGNADAAHHVSHRVIADHLRASSFLIADGVMPSNEGRGYVLRRIMRRAMRHAHLLGCREPLMHRLVPALVTEMGGAYPELGRAQAAIVETLRSEEERFKTTLDRGLKLLDEETARLSKGGVLNGETAFKLYDTYGFPLDLTQDILRGRSMTVDMATFDAAMASQRERARGAWVGSGGEKTGERYFALKDRIGATQFIGYDDTQTDTTVTALLDEDSGEDVTAGEAGKRYLIFTDSTPFYAESGGQAGDHGEIFVADRSVALIDNVTKPLDGMHAHHAMLSAPLKVGDAVTLQMDIKRRNAIRANHSATHLLHKALREVLGDHVTQKGSLVEAEYLRFDFSHGKGLSDEEITTVETKVNAAIWRNSPVETQLMAPDAAIEAGAMALFGEKYGDEVRVLTIGCDEAGSAYSTELCGGTHVAATGDIGLLTITAESAVAAGIRRIEAKTREGAYATLTQASGALKALGAQFKVSPEIVPERVAKLQEDVKHLTKALAEAKKQLALGGSGTNAAIVEDIGGITFTAQLFDALSPKELRGVAEESLKTTQADVVMVATNCEGKASLVIAVAKTRSDTISAVALVQKAVETLGGKGGGGRPEMAQGGGPDAAKLEDAVAVVKAALTCA